MGDSLGGVLTQRAGVRQRQAALALGREPAHQQVEQDHQRSRDQGCRDKAETDDQRINSGHVGRACGDPEDFCILAIDQETIVHPIYPFEKAIQAIGSEVAAETNSIAVMKAPASVVRLWRAVEIVKSIVIPL